MYYKRSGLFSPFGVIWIIIFGGAGAIFFGYLYGYALCYTPIIYLNGFFAAAFAAVSGFITGVGAKLGRVRNVPLTFLFGVSVGFVFIYFSYVGWLSSLTGVFRILIPLQDLRMEVIEVAKEGVWTIETIFWKRFSISLGEDGITPKGDELYVYWVIEALIVLLISGITSTTVTRGVPFCEKCKRWADDHAVIEPLAPILRPSVFIERLEKGDYEVFEQLYKISIQNTEYTELEFFSCHHCTDRFFITIYHVHREEEEEGEYEFTKHILVENFILETSNFSLIEKLAKSPRVY